MQISVMDTLLKSIEAVKNQVVMKNVEGGANANSKVKSPLPVLLNSTSYPLNKSRSKFVSVGLCCYGSFAPAVMISGSQRNDWILLDETEWKALVENQGVLTNYFYSPDFYPQAVNLSPVKRINFDTVANSKVIVLQEKGGLEIYLGEASVSELWDLLVTLECKISLLWSEQFGDFYTQLINGVWDMPGDIKVNIENVLYGLHIKSYNVMCIREMLKYALGTIECDIQVKKQTYIYANDE